MSTSITEKKYKKLSILIHKNGFSFCCFDTLQGSITSYNEAFYDSQNPSLSLDVFFGNALNDHLEFKDTYDSIEVIHSNSLATFVPQALFDENYLGHYLQYNTKVFDTDPFAFDENSALQMNTVYVPYLSINNFCIDQFGLFTFKHAHTILVSKLLLASKNISAKKMYVHLQSTHFDIVVVQNQHLLLFNSFEYQTPQDFLYYILFTAEQMHLNPEEFSLELLGDITEESDYFQLIYKYVRFVTLMDVTDLQTTNSFSEEENRKNFILFNS